MSGIGATAVLIALFALRFVVPLALTVGFCYLTNCLCNRWEARAGGPSGSAIIKD